MAQDIMEDWLINIGMASPGQVSLGLERVEKVRERAALDLYCPVIVVGGTNGKGSVCAMLEAMYREAGYNVGSFTSPHLQKFNERIRVNGTNITDKKLYESLLRVEENRRGVTLTYFEYSILAAVDYFSLCQLDVLILEVGLGGRLDAVNIFDCDCAVITSIGEDHTEYLGNTLEKIANEKSGIFRGGRPAICGDHVPPQSLIRRAARINAPLSIIGRDFGYITNTSYQWTFWCDGKDNINLPMPSLKGAFQLQNASVSLAVSSQMQKIIPLDLGSIKKGLVDIKLVGRFQLVPGAPQVILDVCHNGQAAESLARSMIKLPKVKKTIAVFGILTSKNITSVMSELKPHVDTWIVSELESIRSFSGKQLQSFLIKMGVRPKDILVRNSIGEAFFNAKRVASNSDRIIAFGSFLVVRKVMDIID